MDVDSSDILGGRLPVNSANPGAIWAPMSFSQFTSFVAVAALAAWIVVQHAIPWNRKRQETLYRKAMRRRHGIPDSDHRPFNVAYAAAMQARKEREAGGRHRRGDAQGRASINTAGQTHLPPSQPLRQRTNYMEHTTTQPFTFLDTIGDGALPARTDSERAGNHAATRVANSRGKRARSSSQASSAALEPSRAKHRLDEEVDLEDGNEPKKSRFHESDPIDVDAYSSHEETDEGMDIDMTDLGVVNSKRGFKRSTSQDDDEGIGMSQSHTRGKRARKVSRNQSKEDVLDEAMEEADDIAELESIPRGKKRDRMEAGSTFGGDESFLEDEEEKPRSHRRRRTASHRKASAAARGQKRGREVIDSVESDEGSELSSKRSARQKRGRKGSEDGDLSLDDGMVSHDPLCKGRRIGEEWESNGVTYKVGPNGQRLRQALVKKARSLFPMPKDSHHPDRDANVQVFVETWLSDEEYQEAKVNHVLAWQESPPYAGSPTTSVISGSPTVGKSLLWSSTSVPKDSPRRAPLRQSIVSNSGLRVNPFQSSLAASGRRISTSHSPVIVSPDSPKPRIKSYSKWEKQDLEAAAMAKLREKAQKQAEAEKKAATPIGTPAPSVPPATAPPTGAVKPEKPTTVIDAKPSTPSSFAVPPAPSASTGQFSTTVPAFSFPSSTAPIAKPAESVKPSSLVFPTVTTASSPPAPNKPSSGPSAPSFSFAQPSTAQAPTPSVPTQNFFTPSANPTPKVDTAPPTSGFFQKSAAPSAPPAFSFAPSAPAPVSLGPQNNTIPTITVTRAPSDTFTPAASQPPTQKAEVSWGNPPASTTQAPNPPASRPLFPFGPSSGSAMPSLFQPKPADTSVAAPSSGDPSLASRIGGLATPTSPGTVPQFPFAKSEVPASSSSNPQPQAPPAAVPAQPKFNFGLAPKPSPSPSPLAPASAPPSGEAPKPTPAAFGFAAPQPAGNSPFAPTNPPSHSVGISGTGVGSAFATPKDPASAPKSTFSWAPANASPNPFSTTPASSSAGGSIFGNTTAPSPNPSFGFGASTTTPAGASPSVFGNTSMAPASSSTPTPAPNSFAAPATPAKTGDTQSKPMFSFNFGAQNSSSSTQAFGTAMTANAVPNGSAAPAFGGAQPNGGFSFGSSTPGTFKFGASNTESNQQQK